MIFFRVKNFPQISQTFIDASLVYAKQNDFKIKIYVDKYFGLENSSQAAFLKASDIEGDVEQPFRFSRNRFYKVIQVGLSLLDLKILRSLYSFYRLTPLKNLRPLSTLIQYKNLNNGLMHVHFNNALSPTIVNLTKIKFINPRCIVTYHGYDAFLHDRIEFQRIYGAFYRNNVLAITTNSNYIKKQVINLGVDPNIIRVVPIGIDFNLFKGKSKVLDVKSEIHLITVGRLVQLKGQIYGIRAVKKLVDLGFNIKYTIIGEGNYRNKLEEEVYKLNLDKQISFEGAKSQDEIIAYLRSSSIFLLPSTYDDENGRREAFGLVSLEAQAAGLPVIGFYSGGFPDTIVEGQTGFAVEDRSVEDLKEKALLLIQNPEVYKKMSKAAIENAMKYDHKFTTQKYIDLYSEFLV